MKCNNCVVWDDFMLFSISSEFHFPFLRLPFFFSVQDELKINWNNSLVFLREQFSNWGSRPPLNFTTDSWQVSAAVLFWKCQSSYLWNNISSRKSDWSTSSINWSSYCLGQIKVWELPYIIVSLSFIKFGHLKWNL